MIKLITDSPSDIPKQECEKYNITVMPVPITIDGVTYREGVDMTTEEYYDMLVAAKAIPTHAQVTMIEFMDEYKRNIKAGCTALIVVTITSKGSGIHDAACLAKKMLFEEKPELANSVTIDVVDSRAYAWVYGQAVVAAAEAAAAGADREKVLEVLDKQLNGYRATVGLTNLTYAKKSGRITTVAAFVGEVMGFRPILTLKDGELVTTSKVRGDKKLIDELAKTYLDNVSEDGRPYYILCADSMENAKLLHKEIAKKTKNPFGGYHKLGPSIATNAGPTIFGVITPVAQKKG